VAGRAGLCLLDQLSGPGVILERDYISWKRHPGEGRDLAGASGWNGEIPAFAGMTNRE